MNPVHIPAGYQYMKYLRHGQEVKTDYDEKKTGI